MEGFLELRDAQDAAGLRMVGVGRASSWDEVEGDEPLIHRIHPYPAKFPAFVPSRAFDIAEKTGLRVTRVADIFCGCGTVAFESSRRGLQFWGCDVNPVAALIARAKSSNCSPVAIRRYAESICFHFHRASDSTDLSAQAEERLRRWFADEQFRDLSRLKNSIDRVLSAPGQYRDIFLCAFSAILKPVSRWRARSHKPSLDSSKNPADVLASFRKQCDLLARAWEGRGACVGPVGIIETASALRAQPPDGSIDLLVTSPPYVTSYEYADLHQLSILWLGYASDHRTIRAEMIGSLAGASTFARDFQQLNSTGMHTAFSLYGRSRRSAERAVRYYLDMQQISQKAYSMLGKNGLAVFLIGNTEVHGVKLDNATHLAESLLNSGFSRVHAALRKLSNKANTPYRSPDGRLSSTPTAMSIYSHEYVLIAEK